MSRVKHSMGGNITAKGFTLIELVVVLVIIGILATMAVSHFGVVQEKIIAREAVVHLKIIKTAEETIELETTDFVACVNTTDCNTKLGLDLPTENWDYVVIYNPPGDTMFNATADRLIGTWSNCTYNINGTMNKTANNGNCVYTEE